MPSSRLASRNDGYLLIEVLVGAVLVLAISLGVLSGLDGSTRASGLNKQRSVAASLAQTDQERMRTYTLAHLSNLRATVPVAQTTVGSVKYHVTERADWVSDDSGIANCTSSNTEGSYIEITSTVTWTGMGIVSPVTAQSLVAPPVGTFGAGQGTAGVQVVDRNGDGVPGLSVALGGPGAFNDITDSNGCVVFGYIPTGVYTATTSRGGWVDQGGNNPAQTNCSVPDGSTVACTMSFDQAATAIVNFKTFAYGSGALSSALAQSMQFTNPKMTPPPPETQLAGVRTFQVSSPMNVPGAITAPSLFPFKDGYGIYAGQCPSADPRQAPTFPSGNPGTAPYVLNVGPGQTYGAPTPGPEIDVLEPALNVHVFNAAGQPVYDNYTDSTGSHAGNDPGIVVQVKPTDPSCGKFPPEPITNPGPGLPAPAPGTIPYPGFPFGSYTVCARDSAGHKVTSATVNNTNINGTTVNITLSSSGGGSACPQ